MKQVLKDIFREAVRQLFGRQLSLFKKRGGKLIITPYTLRKMAQYRIDYETLENAFRHGIEYKAGKSFTDTEDTQSGCITKCNLRRSGEKKR
jgi:hypothetical protein